MFIHPLLGFKVYEMAPIRTDKLTVFFRETGLLHLLDGVWVVRMYMSDGECPYIELFKKGEFTTREPGSFYSASVVDEVVRVDTFGSPTKIPKRAIQIFASIAFYGQEVIKAFWQGVPEWQLATPDELADAMLSRFRGNPLIKNYLFNN